MDAGGASGSVFGEAADSRACCTEEQAEAIAEYVDCVLGMARQIDDTAIAFATVFYRAIAAAKNVKDALLFPKMRRA